MNEQQSKRALSELVNKLDLLDCKNFFGAEGWRNFLNIKSVIPTAITVSLLKKINRL